jgi:hypothetical protein
MEAKEDLTNLATLELLAETMTGLSGRTTGMPTTWRVEQASLAFGKIGITCWTFLRTIPGSSFFASSKGMEVWDLSATASLCRNLTEAYLLLCYLVHDPTDSAQREFRQLLWDYHREVERHKMLRLGVPDSRHLADVAKTVAELKSKLEGNAVFRGLKAKRQTSLLNGEDFKLEGPIELCGKTGISVGYYRSNYKYCSAYTHSAPFALSQLRDFKAGSGEAQQLMKTLVGIGCGYSAFAIRDFAALFPLEMLQLSPKVRHIISVWEEILRWEKSAYFGGPPS